MKRVRVTEELAYGTALDRLTGADKPTTTPTESVPNPNEQLEVTMIKLSVFLRREEDTYLEKLASTAKFSGGKKLSKTRLIEAMVRAFRTSKLDVRGVKADEELFKRVIAQLR
ncbi:hypothetical protein ACFLWL_01175 [Chloroflexota bacterium]